MLITASKFLTVELMVSNVSVHSSPAPLILTVCQVMVEGCGKAALLRAARRGKGKGEREKKKRKRRKRRSKWKRNPFKGTPL